jgi:hypothetical protein
MADDLRRRSMSAPERVWHERLCRKLGVNPACGPVLDAAGIECAHELLQARVSEDDDEVERLLRELHEHRVRVEDEHAARLGMPPRPR